MKPGSSFWTVISLAFVTGIAAFVIGELLFFRIMVLWVGVIIFSWLWTYYSLAGIKLRRYSRDDRMESGEFLHEIYEISNISWLWKAWVEVVDQSDIPDNTGSKILTRIGANQIRNYSAYTQIYQRGFYKLGPTKIRSGDLLGIFVMEKVFPHSQNVLITPTIIEIKSLVEPFGFLPGGKSRRRKSPDITPYAAGIREYSAGDPLNKIHWPSTARSQNLMVKEFDQDPQSDVYIILDLDHSIHWQAKIKQQPGKYWMLERKSPRKIQPSSLDYLTSISASISKYYLDRHHAVGTIWREDRWKFLAADRGDRQFIKILEALALIDGFSDLSLDSVLDFQSRFLPRGSLLWLITPVISQSLITAIEHSRMKRLLTRLVVLDPTSFGQTIKSVKLDSNEVPLRIIHASDSLTDIQMELQGGKFD